MYLQNYKYIIVEVNQTDKNWCLLVFVSVMGDVIPVKCNWLITFFHISVMANTMFSHLHPLVLSFSPVVWSRFYNFLVAVGNSSVLCQTVYHSDSAWVKVWDKSVQLFSCQAVKTVTAAENSTVQRLWQLQVTFSPSPFSSTLLSNPSLCWCCLVTKMYCH